MGMSRYFWIVFSALVLLPLPALAGPAFYVDAGGSYVQMKGANTFFNSNSLGQTAYGMDLGIWTTFTHRETAMDFQFGIYDRQQSILNSGTSSSLNLILPAVRLQASRVFLTFAYSPYVFGPSNSSPTGLGRALQSTALLGEMGMLFPITPKFSFGASGSYETIKRNGISGPDPALAGNFFMRFNFGFGSEEASRPSSEFKGWRYPFGREL